MIVISDTSPLNYFILIGETDVLPALYGEIVVPAEVARELQAQETPLVVQKFIRNPPTWLLVRAAQKIDNAIGLGTGETEAISLAIEMKADLILIDDRAAYKAALQRGLNVTGTLTVLAEAANKNLLKLPEAIRKLRTTTFRVPETVIAKLLKLDAEREQKAADQAQNAN